MALSVHVRKDRKRPPPTDDGRMALTDHLREFRNRLFICVLAVVVGFIVAWIFYGQIFSILVRPILDVGGHLLTDKGIRVTPTVNGVSSSFLLQTKVSLVAGIVGASPVWLYELWSFITPGLHRNERKWTITFVAVAGPLFMTGVALGYYVLPKGLSVLLGFTPGDGDVTSLVDLNDYLSFVIRVLLVFGVAFEIPLFVVMLNLAGIVKARQLAKWRSWIIFGTFVFAAVATPSTDPITMLLLAFPMVVLFMVSELIARFIDRRRRLSGNVDYADLDDDEASPI